MNAETGIGGIIDSVRVKFTEIDFYIKEIDTKRGQFEKAVLPSEEKDISMSNEKVYGKLKTTITSGKEELKRAFGILETNRASQSEKSYTQGKTQITDFLNELKKKADYAQKVYDDFKTIMKKKMVRQINFMEFNEGSSDAQTMRQIEDNPDALEKMIQQKMMGKASLKLQNSANDLIEKCEAIKRLQRNVRELLNMILEIAEIIKLQGEKIESISENVMEAKAHMIQANDNLVKAKKHQQAAKCVFLEETLHHTRHLHCDSCDPSFNDHTDFYIKFKILKNLKRVI